MAVITYRVGKASNLTAAQVDANFSSINTELELATAAIAGLSPGTGSDVGTPTAFSSVIDFRTSKAMPVSGFYTQTGAINFTVDTTGAIAGKGTTINVIANGSAVTFSGMEPIGAGFVPTAGQKQYIDFSYSGGIAFYGVAQGATVTVTPSIPTNSTVPTISGTTTQGQTLTATTGTWTNTPTSYAYQWRRAGTAISGATSSTYVLTSTDVGTVITVAVIATNAGGSSTAAVSAGTASIAAPSTPVPVNSVAPAITGTAQVGQTLTVSNGTWSNTPTSYAYQWKRAGTNISGATAQTYVPVTADIGNALTCAVVASNSGGAGTGVTSAATSAVIAAASAGFADDYNRADNASDVGNSWGAKATTVWGISGNKKFFDRNASTATNNGYNFHDLGGTLKTVAEDIYTGTDSGFLAGILIRYIDDNSAVYATIAPTAARIFSFDGGFGAEIANYPGSYASNTTYRLKAVPTSTGITLYVNGTALGAEAPTTLHAASTKGGSVAASPTIGGTFDNFSTVA